MEIINLFVLPVLFSTFFSSCFPWLHSSLYNILLELLGCNLIFIMHGEYINLTVAYMFNYIIEGYHDFEVKMLKTDSRFDDIFNYRSYSYFLFQEMKIINLTLTSFYN